MGVVVFDSDVLIGFLTRQDPHHEAAVQWMRDSRGDKRWLCALNYTEILVGPLRRGRHGDVEEMLGFFGMACPHK